jgi:hypothetical protein
LDDGITENGVVGKCCFEIMKVKGDLRGPGAGRRMLLKWILMEIIQEGANSVQVT